MSEETKKDQANGLKSENNNPEITTNQEAAQEEPDKSPNTKVEAEENQPQNITQEEPTNVTSEEVIEEVAVASEVEEVVEPAPIVDEVAEETTAESIPETQEMDNETPEVVEEEKSTEEPVTPEVVEVVEEGEPETNEIAEAPKAEETPEVEKPKKEKATKPEVKTDSTSEEENIGETPDAEAATEKSKEEDPGPSEEETIEEVVEVIDYTTLSREELVTVVEELAQDEKFRGVEDVLNQVIPLFFAIEKGIKEAAQNKFLLDGGVADDFEFNHDEFYSRFDGSVKLIRDKRAKFYKERESNKESNYQKKLELLDKLRLLVDGDDATTSLAPIKEIQNEWKGTGAVPNQHNRTLWANYNALLDRFYDHRHILFELKELDRKKNQVLKEELCVKAEALDKVKDLKTAIAQLNDLHEEYKHVGPVPREIQEKLWQRFKAASNVVYKKRKSYLDDLKGELQENLVKKKALVEEIKSFVSFDSDRINDWNGKTKEVIAVQKKWETLGGLPREHAKEINKDFWAAFKTFFHHKNEFFKKLEGKRKVNLEAKYQLVEDAKALKDSDDWMKTAEKLKDLQRQWKDVGPVPEKFRNSVYEEFKAACDEFFNNRRDSQSKEEEGYTDNLVKKEALCALIFSKADNKEGETTEIDGFVEEWKSIGFVPKNSIKKIDQKFQKALEVFVASLDVPDEDRESLILKAHLVGMAKGPNADRNLQKKEGAIRRQVKELEDNISLWNNNLAFFANSKTADKLKKEFDEKIEKSEVELQKLKKQLRLIRSI
jgi:uncharacterized protein DUF349